MAASHVVDILHLPVDTARIVTALAYMPPLVDVAEDPLIPGTWCWNAPLWGNPLLPHDRQEGLEPDSNTSTRT